jgi:hypothetical protein
VPALTSPGQAQQGGGTECFPSPPR